MKRLSFVERYNRAIRRAALRGGLSRYRVHPLPDLQLVPNLQLVYTDGFNAGLDPESLDFAADNPHPHWTPERAAWQAGWMTGAESYCRH